MSLPSHPWTESPEEVLAALEVAPDQGLSELEVQERTRRHGPNRLRIIEPRGSGEILLAQFESVIVWLLLVTAVAAFLLEEHLDGWAILAVVAVTVAIGFFTELRAVRSMDALRRLGTTQAVVRRGGETRRLAATELVPGDVVVLEGGDRVVADLRLLQASKLQADESALTGESLPVNKSTAAVALEAPLAERSCMLYKGSAVTRGSGLGVVVSTGMDTEVGRLTSLVQQAQDEQTPLERRLDSLGRELVWVSLVTTLMIAVVGLLAGQPPFTLIKTAVALAAATVPEGLPIVATVALARGMWRMARRKALVNRLSSVETLGATTVILTDKTGTLTENRLTVVRLLLSDGREVDPGDPEAAVLLSVGALCNNASLEGLGEPLEVALLQAAAQQGLKREQLLLEQPELREVAFDPETRLMATFHGGDLVAVKGAPEAVLAVCSSRPEQDLDDRERAAWVDRSRQLAGQGLRVLALARKQAPPESEPYSELTFLGLVAFSDPLRAEVIPALKACRQAGMRVVVVTGDHAATAEAVGRQLELLDEGPEGVLPGSTRGAAALEGQLFYRATPADKLELLRLHQRKGEVVAMLGDGVNDAPALKQADIGVAMGRRGTEVAREAADVVLLDDRFSTILAAVEQGRVIFTNIRKFAIYLLSCNLSELMVVALATVVGLPLPITPLQILYLNLVTDVFPALALGLGAGDPQAMRNPPRDPAEPILGPRHWLFIVVHALMMTTAVLAVLTLALNRLALPHQQAVTLSFLTLAAAQLWHVFNLADGSGVRNEVTTNFYVWAAIVVCLLALAAALTLPGLAAALQTQLPSQQGWLLVAGMSVVPLLVTRFFGKAFTRESPAPARPAVGN